MNRRTCPSCGGRSYSSYSGPDWECPYCGRNLGDAPDESTDIQGDTREEYESSNSGEFGLMRADWEGGRHGRGN